MDNKENEFSPEQSLKLITSMIETTKNSINDNSAYFLLWGWGIFLACVIQYYLKAILNKPYNGMAWLIIPVIVIVQIFIVLRRRNTEKVKTFISDASSYLWTAVGLSYIAVLFVFAQIGWDYCAPFYIIFFAIGTYVSGRLIKFKPLIIGGLICFPLSVITVYLKFDFRIVMLALAILVSYIIPGHLLRVKYKKQRMVNV